jgi:carotenoid cleavage dioxygenase-like enzyme
VRIDDGTLVRTPIAAIPVKEPAYVHAFSTTGRYVVIAEYPLVVRPLTLMLHPKPFIENYRWEPGRAARWYVVDKDGRGLVATYDAPAFFAFHHVNAFDDGDAVVVDVSAYDDASIIDSFLLANLRDPQAPPLPRAELRRYRLIPGHSSAEIETLTGVSTELPRIAPASAATAYRYAYGVNVSAQRPREFINELVKVDVVNRTVASWSQPDAYPGEPVFAARPGGSDEDDGVLLSVVLDAAAGNSFLLVLDARTLEERARAAVPHHIPFGFHGIYAAA